MVGHILLSGDPRIREVKVHPVVLFSVIDSYCRRNEHQDHVYGTLLGQMKGSVVDVQNCYCVRYTMSDDSIALDQEYHQTMLALHQKAHPNEIVVGWYSTHPEINEFTQLVHENYMNDVACPVYLNVRTTLVGDEMNIMAYLGNILGVPTEAAGALFVPIKCTVNCMEGERMGMELLHRGKETPGNVVSISGELERLEQISTDLLQKIEVLLKYVESVQSGKVNGDQEAGRKLIGAVSCIPKVDTLALDQIFNNNLNDILMVVFLSNLTRTQLKIAEKLQQYL
eukprot:Sdes_comp9767_c0_seq2m1287